MRTSWFALLIFVLGGCAKPNYVTVAAPAGTGPEGKPVTCMAHFSSHACVTLVWDTPPSASDFGSFVFKIYRPNLGDASPVVEDLDGDIGVVLWMPGMGHGSSPVSVQRLDIGTYRASKVFFTMHGEWEIRVQQKVQNEVQDQAVLPFSY